MPVSKTSPNSEKGFTIIETLIVLGIAGLILSIVFLAIPTLQRNSRNNLRKQDITAILQALSRYELSNAGDLPANADTYYMGSAKLYYFENNTTSIIKSFISPSLTIDRSQNTDLETVQLYNYQKCDPDNLGKSTYVGAGYHDVVALYAIETSGLPAGRCQQL